MSNTINVSACDNELIILAYQWGGSFELCRILNGNAFSVNQNITINNGPYQGTQIISNGITGPINGTSALTLPSGVYTLLLLGIDWGGPQEFTATVNGKKYVSPPASTGEGLVWNSGPITITV
jgi:hypothetical protein